MNYLYRIAALVTLVVTALIATTAVSAATPRDPRVPALQAKVATLNAKVASLQSTVASLQSNIGAIVTAIKTLDQRETKDYAASACMDTYQQYVNISTYNVLAAILSAAPWSQGYPSDNGACAAAGIAPPSAPAALRSTAGVSPFSALGRMIAAA